MYNNVKMRLREKRISKVIELFFKDEDEDEIEREKNIKSWMQKMKMSREIMEDEIEREKNKIPKVGCTITKVRYRR